MERTRKLLLTLSCLTCVAGAAQAGEDRLLPVGTLVRVTAPGLSPSRLTGSLLSASDREIVLALPDSEPITIERGAVTRLEWSRGHRRHPAAGAVVGALIGGAFLAYASMAVCDAASCSPSMEAVLIGAGLGALPGAGVGALIRTRHWADVEPSRVQISIAPVPGHGVAAKLSVRF